MTEITNSYKICGIKQQKLTLSSSRGQKSENKMLQGHGASKGFKDVCAPCLLQLPAAPAVLWLMVTSFSISALMVEFHLLFCPSHIRICMIACSTHLGNPCSPSQEPNLTMYFAIQGNTPGIEIRILTLFFQFEGYHLAHSNRHIKFCL